MIPENQLWVTARSMGVSDDPVVSARLVTLFADVEPEAKVAISYSCLSTSINITNVAAVRNDQTGALLRMCQAALYTLVGLVHLDFPR